jgi:RNA polymerase sigma-70 factor (ECF subfamily)
MTLTENEIFDAWRGNPSPNNQEALCKRLQYHAEYICWRILGCRQPEVVQDAILHVLTKPETFKGESKFSTWFQAVAKNLALMELRKRKTLVPIPEDMAQESFSDSEVKLLLEDLKKELSEDEVKMVELLMEGYSIQEIAKLLEEPTDTIYHRFVRLKPKVGKFLKGGG